MKVPVNEEHARKRDPYTQAGVDSDRQERALGGLLAHIGRLPSKRQLLPIGLFANVLDLGQGLGLAIAMDGVGTKALIAQMMDKYDTIGIDCIAMNVNDLICVGATPIAMLDYLAVREPDQLLFEEIGAGLERGALEADIEIPGGEIAQIRDMLHGFSEERAFDLAGCAVGTVVTDKIIAGRDLREGDVVVGLRSSGIHSNGLSLARRVLLEGEFGVGSNVAELGRTVGEELLEPTTIYVKPVLEMFAAGLNVKSLAHITGDGFMNLRRVDAPFGFVIETLPKRQPIFDLIARLGDVPNEEMFRVYNMGIGFCVVLDPSDADEAIAIAAAHDIDAVKLGYAQPDPEHRIRLEPEHLVSEGSVFVSSGA